MIHRLFATREAFLLPFLKSKHCEKDITSVNPIIRVSNVLIAIIWPG
jgi:hypothetical protein